MDHHEAGRYWDANAPAWIKLSREGYDVYRDLLNTPAFLEILPDVQGREGLDLGCGEGHNTRQVARRGARMIGIDISPTFIRAARETEDADPLGIIYCEASAVDVPFPAGQFDFCTAFMSLMDIPETATVLQEAARVLRPGGFLQFSISHPCTETPHRRNLRGLDGRTRAIEIGGYFEDHDGQIEEWLFKQAPPHARAGLSNFQVPRFRRTLSQWFNLLVDSGFMLEHVEEPCPSQETADAHPEVQDARVVPYFLHMRGRKPETCRWREMK